MSRRLPALRLEVIRQQLAHHPTDAQVVFAVSERENIGQRILRLPLEKERIGGGPERFEIAEIEIRRAKLLCAIRQPEDTQTVLAYGVPPWHDTVRILVLPSNVKVVGRTGAENVDIIHNSLPAMIGQSVSRPECSGRRSTTGLIAEGGRLYRRCVSLGIPDT